MVKVSKVNSSVARADISESASKTLQWAYKHPNYQLKYSNPLNPIHYIFHLNNIHLKN